MGVTWKKGKNEHFHPFPHMVITNRGCQLMHLVPSFHFHWVVMGGLLHSLQAPEGVVGPGGWCWMSLSKDTKFDIFTPFPIW